MEGGDAAKETPGTLPASIGEGKIDGEPPETEEVEAFAKGGSGDGEGEEGQGNCCSHESSSAI